MRALPASSRATAALAALSGGVVRPQSHITVMDIKKARRAPPPRTRHASLTHRVASSFAQVTRAFTAEDLGKFVPIVAFDCRGCEPTAWHPDKARPARRAAPAHFSSRHR